MQLSVVIPTYNEEERLPGLLQSLLQEKFSDMEIIVADRPGRDRTREIAASYGCKITDGGSPAEGRNLGARLALGKYILFLDADIKFLPGLLQKTLTDAENRKLVVASYHLYPQENSFWLNNFTINLFYNWQQNLWQKVFPMGAMGILVKKEIFDKVGGFDATIKLAEDVYFVGQAARFGKFGIIKGAALYMPLRRFERDGYLRTAWKYFLCGLHMAFIGPVRSGKVFDYNFNHYDDNNKKQ